MKIDNHKSKSHSRLRVTAVLILAIIAVVFAFLVSLKYSKDKLQTFAHSDAQKDVKYLSAIADFTFLSSEWTISSYLAAWADIQYDSLAPADSYPLKYVFYDEDIRDFDFDDIYAGMQEFLFYNTSFLSCVLIFEPGMLQHYPDGVTSIITPDSVSHNLGVVNFRYSDFYRDVAQKHGMCVKSGFSISDSTFMLTHAIPIYNSNNVQIGEFWVDTKNDYVSNILKSYQAKEDALVAIVNQDNVIVSSSDPKLNGVFLDDVMLDENRNAQWREKVKHGIEHQEKEFFTENVFGHECFTYVTPIVHTPFSLLVVKPKSEIFQVVYKSQWILMVIMLLGILIVAICLMYIYINFKKKNEETQHLEAELDVASQIQQGMLPQNPPSPPIDNFNVFGFQQPAKSVGGDLYDFVVKDNYLHFCIGDVSGKGVPAAMVMSEICSLYRNLIRRATSPEVIVFNLNNSIMERSDDSMFCTLFVGVLNLDNGFLEFCNAGHNPPIFSHNNSTNFLTIKPNMPINAFENYNYQKESLQLSNSDRLFLYTDGITEAKNTKNEFFGSKNTLNTIQQLHNKPFNELTNELLEKISLFTQTTEQHDDITIFCLEYKNLNNRKSLHYDSVKDVVTIVNDILDICDLSSDTRLRLALEEPVQNISQYAYSSDGPLDVVVLKNPNLQTFDITLIDSGVPFNPLQRDIPNLNIPIEEREVGGLGIYFTRQIASKLDYKFENKRNKLTLKYKKP